MKMMFADDVRVQPRYSAPQPCLRVWHVAQLADETSRIFDVWHKRAIPHCPDIRPIGELQELVHDYSASFLCAGERRDKRARHGSGSPHQGAAWNWDVLG